MDFDYANRSQLEAFDLHCLEYGREHRILTQDCPALRMLYDLLINKGLAGNELARRISLALEIKVSFLQTHYDLAMLLGIENKYLVKADVREKYRPLCDIPSLDIALKRGRAAFSLVTRIRSIWDKIFLYVALSNQGDSIVRRLQGQRSKRTFFFKHFASGFGSVTPETLVNAKCDLDKLEANFRTPELHGFGNIRKWILDTPANWDTQYSGAIVAHWTTLSRFLFCVFDDCCTTQSSLDS